MLMLYWLKDVFALSSVMQTPKGQGLSEPEFYGDLVYKIKKIMGSIDVSDQFRKTRGPMVL